MDRCLLYLIHLIVVRLRCALIRGPGLVARQETLNLRFPQIEAHIHMTSISVLRVWHLINLPLLLDART